MFIKKRWLMLFILLSEILIIAGCMVKAMTKERYSLELLGIDFIGEEHPVALAQGSYEIELTYQTKEDGIYCRAVYDTSYGRIFAERIFLPRELGQKKFEVRLNEPTDYFFLLTETESQENAEDMINIKQISVRETGQMDTAYLTLLLFAFLLADMVWLLWKKEFFAKISQNQRNSVLTLLGIWILTSIPLFVNYMITGDDFVFHAMRIEGIAEGLKAGQFPVRIQPGWLNGYGYPVSVMYGDLLLYFPALLRIAGFTLQAAYKCYVFVINGITVLSAYYCVWKITDERKYGILGSLLYTISAYRILNVYFRCAVGEYTAMAFFPLVLVGLHIVLYTEEKLKGQLCLIVAYSLILQSHLLSCEMILLFSALYCLLQWKYFWKKICLIIQAAFAAFVVNLAFLVPFLNYMKTQDLWIKGGTDNRMQENGLFFSQLFQTFAYGGGGSASVGNGVASDMPIELGIVFVVILALFVWEMLIHGKEIRANMEAGSWREQWSIFFMTILAIWMSCYFFPWKKIGDIPFIGKALTVYQFAWRFLAVAVAAGSLLGGLAIKNLQTIHMHNTKKENIHMLLFAIGLLSLLQGVYLIDSRMASAEVSYVTSTAGMNSVYAVSGGEYMLSGAQRETTYDTQVYCGETVVIKSATRNAQHFWISCENRGNTDGWVQVPLFAYLGYRAYDITTGEELKISFDANRILKVILPAEYSGELEVVFQEPVSWRLAELVSLFGLVGILAITATTIHKIS